jgi:sulfur carrier protein
MEVLVNGNLQTLDQASTVKDLIITLQLDGKFAIEINQNIIPRSEYNDTKLSTGDKIEIVEAIGGG